MEVSFLEATYLATENKALKKALTSYECAEIHNRIVSRFPPSAEVRPLRKNALIIRSNVNPFDFTWKIMVSALLYVEVSVSFSGSRVTPICLEICRT
jgi:hypothetical protein